jgi:hypothetical protein
MPREFSLPVVQEIFPPQPASAPGAAPQPADPRHTLPPEPPWEALSQRSLVAASLIVRS